MVSWEWFEGRLARVSVWRLLASQLPTVAMGIVFLVGTIRTGRTGWAMVFGVLLVLEIALVVAWSRVKVLRRRDAHRLQAILRRP